MDDLIYHTRYWVEQDPQRLAFRMCDSGEDVSFAQLEARANQGAHLLRGLGLKRGDHILVLMENRREFLEVCFAADRAGLYYTTASTHLSPDELSYMIGDCGAGVVIVSDRFADRIARLHQDIAGLRVLVVGDKVEGCDNWSAIAAEQPETPIADESQGLDMLYSSGTTGRPKGIKWEMTDTPAGGRTMLIDLLGGLFGYSREARYLSPAPLYHAAPLRHSMVTIKSGGSVFIMSKFDAEGALKLIERHRITHSQWVPTMFVRLLKLPEALRAKYDVSSLRMAVHAAAPCPVEVKQRMIEWWGPVIHEYYAGTENNGFTAIDTAEWLSHVGSVGRAKLGKIHICDESGQELPIGSEGEIYFENGHQFTYHNDPEKTAASRNAQGWTTLGDIGRVDEEGYLYLTDRKSFVIISGGVNIYPQETENALLDHPAVLDVAVIGVPNEDFGEEVKAVVQTVAGQQGSPALEVELIEWCRARLSAIKCPRSVDFRSTLPRTETGKLVKRQLWREYRGL
ncbi:acyl-CoA synthetase [Paracoccus seriniphilus]|uniref:Acyl-CoA synthetase (AMP-forming)/AMP-acid ligase II n=1 Tax=Paracoccus seriniphilus TaxID=184748 RepID=A0A239PT44_9RHOB|nr:acyl-CoA synthetase [Paracoccus seriniphilus]WCR16395.1 acyl-CoA synthetase [Paracoccus seriniphilus]SNT73464.1 Acyl-CoA synthetase (AMP-forming)/AMP-acid ligase II [Paracoccus seriniphilus]